jgi:hypothetical protein
MHARQHATVLQLQPWHDSTAFTAASREKCGAPYSCTFAILCTPVTPETKLLDAAHGLLTAQYSCTASCTAPCKLLQLLVSSSLAVYGQAYDAPVTEERTCCKPATIQGHAAQLVEAAVQAYAAATPSFSAATLRHGTVIGAPPRAKSGVRAKNGRQQLPLTVKLVSVCHSTAVQFAACCKIV